MTTLISFTPNINNNPAFIENGVILDGIPYTLTCTWNVAGARYYYQLTDQYSNTILNAPLIGSPLHYEILLAPDLFNQSKILFRQPSNNFEVTP